jgi:CheY-like chemotaxis protein
VVSSGSEALAAVGIDHFDVVLMDVEMPGMDGIETAQRIRMRRGAQAPYIAAVTAHATREMRQRLLAGEMEDFLAKPVVRSELAHLLQRAAERAAQRRG